MDTQLDTRTPALLLVYASGFLALTAAFVVQKLTAAITWSWFWVLTPVWFTALVVLLIAAVAFVREFRKTWREEAAK